MRLVKILLEADKKVEALKVIDKYIPEIKARKGCLDCKFIMNDDEGEYYLVVSWDSSENADAAMVSISPRFLPEINKFTVVPALPRLFKVY